MNNIRRILGVNLLHNKGITGKNINVAILDTGMYLHNDLHNNLVTFEDIVNKRKESYDDNSHGTHISGILAGTGRQSNGLYCGIAPDAGIIPIKVLNNNGTCDSENLFLGIQWILKNKDNYDIKIVNISIGTTSSSCDDENSLLVRAVDSLWDCGLTVIASAGNNGPGYKTITTPGISRKIITVGTNELMTHRQNDGSYKITYSGKGPTHCNVPKPDIIAPGSHIVSCYYKNNGYISKSGTSMSTPIVSGAAALLLSYEPSLSNQNIKEIFCKTADDMGYDIYTQGCGRINPYRALLSI